MVASGPAPQREPLIPFEDVCRLKWLPRRRRGSNLSARTLTRWRIEGQRVNGRVIRLRARRVGSTWCTTEAWLDEHFAAVDQASAGPAGGPAPDAKQNKSEVAAILDAAGI